MTTSTKAKEQARDALALEVAADLVEERLAQAATPADRVAWGRALARLVRLRGELLRGPVVIWETHE